MLKKKSFQTFALLKGYAQKSQLGEIFTFDKLSTGTDGVFRTTSRGWYTFAHLALALIFFFGHLWYGGRALFSDLSAGITISGVLFLVEFGFNEKLGDKLTIFIKVLL